MLGNEIQATSKIEVKRDPRIIRTRQLLQTALTELLREKSFSEITVGDIADRATVNRATFYAHFEDKYALLRHMIHERFETMLNAKMGRNPGFTLTNLRLLAITAYEFLGGFMGHCATALPNPATDYEAIIALQVQTCIYEIVLTWIRALPPHNITQPPEVAANITSWAIFGSTFQSARSAKRVSPEDLADQMLPVLTTGIGAMLA